MRKREEGKKMEEGIMVEILCLILLAFMSSETCKTTPRVPHLSPGSCQKRVCEIFSNEGPGEGGLAITTRPIFF